MTFISVSEYAHYLSKLLLVTISTDVTEMHIAWGPCIEPAWAQVGLALDRLNKATVDPSNPMPFWDKSRLLLHGRLIASMQKCNLLLLSTRDPYVSTEQLDTEWQNIYMDWTNGEEFCFWYHFMAQKLL